MSFKLNGELVDEMYGAGGEEKPDKSIETQEKKANQIKKMVLRKKIQAVSSGAGKEIMASHEPEGESIDEADTAYEKARKAAARRAADRNAKRRAGKMGGNMERETYTNEAGVRMHYKGYKANANEDINPFVQSSLEALGSIVKKNSNLDEEGYDHLRDRGMVRPSKDKKDGTSYPPSAEMKKTQKVNTGPSAAEIVKKKYGKAVMDMSKK